MTTIKDQAWKPRPYKARDAAAIQALNTGTATDRQQKLALAFIIETLCRTYDVSFDPDSSRISDFAEGTRWVGLQLVKLTKVSLSELDRREELEKSRNERRARKA